MMVMMREVGHFLTQKCGQLFNQLYFNGKTFNYTHHFGAFPLIPRISYN